MRERARTGSRGSWLVAVMMQVGFRVAAASWVEKI
jgi:hypothetical protein